MTCGYIAVYKQVAFHFQELGLRHTLHRKKVQLALQAIGSDSQGRMDELDHNWVLRKLSKVIIVYSYVILNIYR